MKSSLLFLIAFVGSFLLIHLKQMASAESGKIAFTLLHDGNGGIYIIDDNGENLRRLTDHLAHDSYPVWLPDGRHIAFCSNRDGAFSIYTMDLAGKNIKRIVDLIGRPAVSPDGRWIALTPDGILLLVAIDGLKQREIHWGRPQGVTGMAA
jgi:Tol biopolymer transport system component